MILLLVPGLAWIEVLLPGGDRLLRWAVGLGLSYALAMCLGLLLHYLPGPIPLWIELMALDLLILLPTLVIARMAARGAPLESQPAHPARPHARVLLLLVILLAAAFFRFTNLGYSEFQGDEALAMITASEALEGHQDALFLRGKGPGEVLLPMVLWRLTGTIDELMARIPFAVAGVLMVLTGYLVASRLFSQHPDLGQRAGLLAASLLALNGFLVGFSRIVQYQTLVVWMSGLALLCAWEWRQTGRARWMALSGILLGVGLLAHYDAVLVVPAIAYVIWTGVRSGASTGPSQASRLRAHVWPVLAAAGCSIVVAGLFYFPYLLDPQAVRTGSYLGDRIGGALIKNNLDSFQRFNVFYTSSYYYILTGLLVLGYLAWALTGLPGVRRVPTRRYGVSILAVAVGLGMAVWPHALGIPAADLAALPFALILAGALLSSSLDVGQRVAVVWLAIPFLGYNFGVALPLTHIYTIVPAWTLLAGLALAKLLPTNSRVCHPGSRIPCLKSAILILCALVLTGLFGGYLYTAYLRHDIEFRQDWPHSLPALYWTPHDQLPAAGFFGFSHRAGWKAVGTLYADGGLKGDYASNEEPDVTAWYTRGAPRACDPQPEYYFIADAVVDPWPVDFDHILTSYDRIGGVSLANDKGLAMFQTRPSSAYLGDVDIESMTLAFNRSATPMAFARSARGSQPANANLGGLVRLIGYDVDARRAWPDGRVTATLYWQAMVPVADDYHAFVHLEEDREDGSTTEIWGQADGRPVCWTYPTFDWRPGQIIADHHAVAIRPDTPSGDYHLLAGLYLPRTGQRLDVLDEASNPVSNSVELTIVTIR
jgi:uncharacterized membrane protein